GARQKGEPVRGELSYNEPSNESLMQRALDRSARLVESDAELRAVVPSPEAMAKIRACASSIESVAMACALYANRPCLGQRVFRPDGDSLRALPEFSTLSYSELWGRVAAFASGLAHAGLASAGAFVGICGFGSVEWVVADLACLYLAAVSVPLQTSL